MNGSRNWSSATAFRPSKSARTITRRRWQTEGWQEEYGAGIGKEIREHGIRCIFTPTLSRLVADVFDCVEVDEGVRLKSTDSYISTGVRGMNPKTRLVLSATPIKNRLEDIFWLAQVGRWLHRRTPPPASPTPIAPRPRSNSPTSISSRSATSPVRPSITPTPARAAASKNAAPRFATSTASGNFLAPS